MFNIKVSSMKLRGYLDISLRTGYLARLNENEEFMSPSELSRP